MMDAMWLSLSVIAWLISVVEIAVALKSWGRKSSKMVTHAVLWVIVVTIFVLSASSDNVDNMVTLVTGILMIVQGVLWEINYKLTKKNHVADKQQ